MVKMQKKRRKKIIAALLLATLAVSTVGSVAAYAGFGSGVAVIASDVKIIKTALKGQKVIFSDTDFKQGLCLVDFEKIKIKSLPLSSEGTLMLAGRRVGEGAEIKRKNLGALVFIPASKDVEECKFIFTTESFADGADVEFVIKFTDKINTAPKTNASATEETSLNTQREISVYGKMSATDAENDVLEYLVVGYPKVGALKVLDKNSGEYLYTPPADYIGTDSFSYVAMDVWGNFSKICKVDIEVKERMSDVVYVDMKNHPDYNSAVTLTAMSVMDGNLIGDGVYFMPEDKVTRAEFVTMAMKCAGINPVSSISSSFFDDNDEIPAAMMQYVATAQSLGIINGSFEDGELLFKPNEAITKYEAGVIMSNILGATSEGDTPVFNDISEAPVWAHADIYAMCHLGIFESDTKEISATAVLTKAEIARYLCKMMECK